MCVGMSSNPNLVQQLAKGSFSGQEMDPTEKHQLSLGQFLNSQATVKNYTQQDGKLDSFKWNTAECPRGWNLGNSALGKRLLKESFSRRMSTRSQR